jgi:aminoglycoside phosphotransferase (APT) family kinase protein
VLTDGRKFVVRIHPLGVQNRYFDVETAALVAARGIVPVAGVISVVHDQPSGGLEMMIIEEMSGTNMKIHLTSHPEDEAELVHDMGRTMAKIHTINVTGYGFFDNDIAKSTGKLKGIKSDFREHILAALPKNLEVLTTAGYMNTSQADKITELLENSTLLRCKSPKLLHNDMADWNVLVSGSKISAVLDWDECFGGDPVADIACWSLFFTPERLKIFLQGYHEVSSPDKDFAEKLHIYRLRYIVSKMTLRHKKLNKQNDDIMQKLIQNGLAALRDEFEYFNI